MTDERVVSASPLVLLPAFWRRLLGVVLTWMIAEALSAADSRPVVGPGATKEDVINAYGWPTGQSALGAKEILNYPQGSITLSGGKVERVDFSTSMPWPAPRPRPGAAAVAAAAKAAESKSFDPWTTSFAAAIAQANKQHARILAAFVGSDWSPPSGRFLDEVATHPDFVNGLMSDFVFLKLDFPTHVAQSAELKKQNEELRARCGVTTYPALMVVSARGDPIAVVNLARETAGDNYRAQVIAAVNEVRELLKQGPPAAEPKPAAKVAPDTQPAASAPGTAAGPREDGIVKSLMASAGWALMLGLGGGALLAAALVWWMWRSRLETLAEKPARSEKPRAHVRLRDLPSIGELRALPVDSLRRLVAALFETNGYQSTVRTDDADFDVELRRRGHTKANVLVCCRTATAGVIGAKQVREFFAALVASGVDAGWIVAAGGFAGEAHAVADERGIELIDGEGLIERLRQLPTAELGQVLSRAGA